MKGHEATSISNSRIANPKVENENTFPSDQQPPFIDFLLRYLSNLDTKIFYWLGQGFDIGCNMLLAMSRPSIILSNTAYIASLNILLRGPGIEIRRTAGDVGPRTTTVSHHHRLYLTRHAVFGRRLNKQFCNACIDVSHALYLFHCARYTRPGVQVRSNSAE